MSLTGNSQSCKYLGSCVDISRMMILASDIAKDWGINISQVPVGKTVYDSNGLFALNELGAFIWHLLPSVETEAQIVDAVLAEYDVSAEEAAKDVAEFMNKLKEMNII